MSMFLTVVGRRAAPRVFSQSSRQSRGLARLTEAKPLHTTDESHEDLEGLEDIMQIDGDGKFAMIMGGFGMKVSGSLQSSVVCHRLEWKC